MRIDKLTTKFQEALADAQSLALGNDHAYIEPVPCAGRHAAPAGSARAPCCSALACRCITDCP